MLAAASADLREALRLRSPSRDVLNGGKGVPGLYFQLWGVSCPQGGGMTLDKAYTFSQDEYPWRNASPWLPSSLGGVLPAVPTASNAQLLPYGPSRSPSPHNSWSLLWSGSPELLAIPHHQDSHPNRALYISSFGASSSSTI